MHENEILGTVFAVVFALVAAGLVITLWNGTAPLWAALTGTVVLGGLSVWALVKTAAFWIKKMKDR